MFIFFYGRVFHIVFGEPDPLFGKRAKVERVVLNALVKVDAALLPKFEIEQRFAGNAQKILRIRRLVLASSSEKSLHLSLSA